jgi:hypothetical protein
MVLVILEQQPGPKNGEPEMGIERVWLNQFFEPSGIARGVGWGSVYKNQFFL